MVTDARSFHRLVDKLVAGASRSYQRPCRSGCSDCCIDSWPTVFWAEAELIGEYLRQRPDVLGRAVARARAWAKDNRDAVELVRDSQSMVSDGTVQSLAPILGAG